ncbi:Putative peptidoglycan binding domain protein [Planctomycetes bacterium MalM25]|nr:Putative peptidoglycan binding domain protein [Planctomycetes bacterium MalM25]
MRGWCSVAGVSAVVVVLVSAVGATAADYEFYGRSGDLIEIDLGSLPGVPGGAAFSSLEVGGFGNPHSGLTSSTLNQGTFANDGRFWVLPNPAADTPGEGDVDPAARGFQGVIQGNVRVNGVLKSFEVTVRPGYTGAGVGSVGQSLERLNRAANNELYVAQQQQRLRYLGYQREGGGEIVVDGDFGPNTDAALRTFQAAIVGGVNTTQANVDGIIGPNTAGWLNAANAPTWDELIDPDPQPTGTFSVSRMIGDFDLLPSCDPGGGCVRSGNTPQIERFGTSWAIELMEAGSAAAKDDTGITQLMNGMSTLDGYGSSAFHSTHRAGMDIDLHVTGSTHNFGNGSVSAAEQGVIDTAVAFIDAGSVGGPERGSILRIISSNEDILDGIRAARPSVSLSFDSSGGHRNHLHVDVGAPAQVAGLANLPGDFNLDGLVDAGDYTVWRDGLGVEYTTGDYTLWANNFGAGDAPGSAVAVPEPMACLIALAGCLVVPLALNRR